MKTKFTLFILFLFLLISRTFAQIPESANRLLNDFDFKAAKKIMDEKHIPGSDRKGYLEYLMRQHIVTKDPDFFYPYIAFYNSHQKRSKWAADFCSNV